jgi:hypothetical protein
MGHIHLGVLPRGRRWREVVDLLTDGASDGAVVAASARAAEHDLLSASDSPRYVESVRLLLSVPLAARADDFGEALRDLGLKVGSEPSVLELTLALSERLDQTFGASSDRTDLGELASRALVSTVSLSIGDALPGLFAPTGADVQAAARRLSWSKGIAELTRAYYTRLVSGSLSYWLDRTLAQHSGRGARFVDAGARGEFDIAVQGYSMEATRIIQEFSGGWYGKTIHTHGYIPRHSAVVFGAVALKKIVEELRVRREPHD